VICPVWRSSQQGESSKTFVLVIPRPVGVPARLRRQVGSNVAQGLNAGFLIHRNGHLLASLGALLLIESHLLVDDQDFMHPDFKVWIPAFQGVALLLGLYRMRFENALNGGFSGLAQGGMPGPRPVLPGMLG